MRIAGEGGIAGGTVGDGRLLPVLILDTTSRPDIDEYIRLHENFGPGDVRVQWAERFENPGEVLLVLTAERPAELIIVIAFEMRENHGILVDQILKGNGFYLQAGKKGDRVRHTLDRPRIIIEVPDTGFGPHWEKVYTNYTYKALRAKGMDRADAKRGARQAIEMLRRFGAMRMPS